MHSCTPQKKTNSSPLKNDGWKTVCFPFKMVRAHRAHLVPSQVTKTGAKFGEKNLLHKVTKHFGKVPKIEESGTPI